MAAKFYANPFFVVLDASNTTWTPPAACRVLMAWYIMTGAGATGDKIKITDGTNDISDDIDVSAVGDTDMATLGEIDDAHRDLVPGTDTLTSVHTSAAACEALVMLAWTN